MNTLTKREIVNKTKNTRFHTKKTLANKTRRENIVVEKLNVNLKQNCVLLKMGVKKNKRTCCVGLYLNISLVSLYHLTECSFCSSILKWQLSSAARRGSAYNGTLSCDMSCADVVTVKDNTYYSIYVMYKIVMWVRCHWYRILGLNVLFSSGNEFSVMCQLELIITLASHTSAMLCHT